MQIFAKVDQKSLECLQFKDGSVYYGQSQLINDKKVRHGVGFQIIPVKSASQDTPLYTKYQGQFNKDQRHGEGTTWYSDNSIYTEINLQGNMIQGQKHGFGVMKYSNGHQYEGEWQQGLMHGKGVFHHQDVLIILKNFSLEGVFYKNYFIQSEGVYINPFLNKQELFQFQKDIQVQLQIKHENLAQYWFFFKKIQDLGSAYELLKTSNKNNRFLMILQDQNYNLNINQLKQNLRSQGQIINIFDVLYCNYLKKTDKNKYEEYMQHTKIGLANTLYHGEYFCINMDDSDSKYQLDYDVNLKEFYRQDQFPCEIWNLKALKRQEFYSKIYRNTEYDGETTINDNFNIFLWSKFYINNEELDKKIIEQYDKRFSGTLNLDLIDLAMLESNN